ncbi:MAG: N-acetyltransferase [Pseudomonadaceae bacterium]|nr:MAG: N-acetyltransferase [Pseudomonadaceae bacterium]
MKIRQLDSLSLIDADAWNGLLGSDYPFLQHGFLHALESSGSVSMVSGWQPAHCVVESDAGELLAALPLYAKHHSYGEYVFDWAWAEAWERAGRSYYPKLLSAVPFSPVQGPRLLGQDVAAQHLLLTTLDNSLQADQISSLHLLFNTGSENDQLEAAGWLQRLGCQFHWFNRGYAGFDDFLAQCTSRKRKNFRKERQAVAEQGIEFYWRSGAELEASHWATFYPFYAATYYKRGQQPYLTPSFFSALAESMPSQVHLLFACHQGKEVAAALFLSDKDTLYGRYWGCLEEYDRLHFETCFYRGMERCIELGLQRFDAGAQGEHKLIRGFEPVLTQSWHKLQTGLHEAVADFLLRERAGIQRYHQEAREVLPYRQASDQDAAAS